MGHGLFVDENVGALELGDQDFEEHVLPFPLLVGVRGLLVGRGEQAEIGVLEREFQEGFVVVRQLQVDLFVVLLPFLALFLHEHPEGEGEADDSHHVAEGFERGEHRHSLLLHAETRAANPAWSAARKKDVPATKVSAPAE